MDSGGHQINVVMRRFSVCFMVFLYLFSFSRSLARSHARTLARAHARTRARAHARTRARARDPFGPPIDPFGLTV